MYINVYIHIPLTLEHHYPAILPLLEGEGRLLPLARDLAQLPLDLALLVGRVADVLDLLLLLWLMMMMMMMMVVVVFLVVVGGLDGLIDVVYTCICLSAECT